MQDAPHRAETGIVGVEAAEEEDMVEDMEEIGIEDTEEEEEGTEEEEDMEEEEGEVDAAGTTTIRVVDRQVAEEEEETGIAAAPPAPVHITEKGPPVRTARGGP